MIRPSRLCFLALTAAALAGCAKPGDFPSLMPRPAERAATEPVPEAPAPPPRAADAALASRLATLVANAEAGQREFEQELARARPAIARAGRAESESWIDAQLALSRLEASRTPTVNAAAEIDALALERGREGAAASDIAAIAAASERVDALALAQRDAIVRLGTELEGD